MSNTEGKTSAIKRAGKGIEILCFTCPMERLKRYVQQRRQREYMGQKKSILGNLFLVLLRGTGNQVVYRHFITGYGCLWKIACVFLSSCVDLPQCGELGIFGLFFFRYRYLIIDMHVKHIAPQSLQFLGLQLGTWNNMSVVPFSSCL